MVIRTVTDGESRLLHSIYMLRIPRDKFVLSFGGGFSVLDGVYQPKIEQNFRPRLDPHW